MKFTSLFTTYPTIVVYDTEFTSWEGAMERGWSGPNEYRELVQIAAQKIDIEKCVVLDSFEELVLPTINPRLSNFFIELTGITQNEIDNKGVEFATALHRFLHWSADYEKFAYGADMSNQHADAVVLQENIEIHNLNIQLDMNKYQNLYHIFRKAGFDPAPRNSGRVYEYFNIDLTGYEHNAMFDVESLVQSLFEVKRRIT